MAGKQIRGLDKKDFASKQQILRDHRTTWQRLRSFAQDRRIAAGILALLAILVLMLPLVWECFAFLALVYGLTIMLSTNRAQSLPNLLPRDAGQKIDPNQPLPGGQGYAKPSGDMYLGVERSSRLPVWFRFSDWLRHGLVTGTTGSGKTELLITIAYNFLCAGGSGLMFADPKGDIKVAFKLSWIAKKFGREDDLLFCNYQSPDDEAGQQTTNTSNPTAYGSHAEIANMLVSMLPKSEGGNNAVFAENAVTLVQVLSRCLVDLRDQGQLELSWSVFRENLSLDACLQLAQNENLSDIARTEMALFIHAISGVIPQKPAAEQSQTAHDQFGYIASYCQRGLATLTGSFGFIYDCKYGDISYRDVVQRQRILLSILPSLQYTQQDISMLGKIDLFGKKQALAEGLPNKVQGTAEELLSASFSAGVVPSLNIMDEYKYISVPGMSIAATQGRSLGWASIIGVQSYAGLTVDGEAEGDEWLENTATKIIGSAQGDSTFDKLQKIVGQEYIARTEGRTAKDTWGGGVIDKQDIRFEKQSVLDIRDVRAQNEGQFTVVVADREIRLQSLFIETPIDNRRWDQPAQASIIMNTFVDLPMPALDSVHAYDKNHKFYTAMMKGEFEELLGSAEKTRKPLPLD